MTEKVRKTVPWFIVLSLVLMVVIIGFNFGQKAMPERVSADTATTSVIVGNAAPIFSAVVEDPSSAGGKGEGSTAGNPTNEGDNITWKGTASDSNADDWYLAICKSDAIATTGASAPTCPGGTWVVSTRASSSVEATAATSTTGVSATSSDWWAFACDHTASQKCSTGNQGTSAGDGDSPFNVNHRPAFTQISNDGPQNPGVNVTWNSTTSDADKFDVDDWIGLYICKSQVFATGTTPACTGGEWCSATSSSDTTCSYAVPTPTPDTTYNAYAYIVDNHGFDSSDATQSEATSYDVNNIAPTVSAATISVVDGNAGTLDLTNPEGETSGFEVNATIVDNNSCENASAGNEIATSSVASTTYAWAYRSGVTSECSANPNNCYLYLDECTLGPCGGTADGDVTTTCSFSMWYVADPTDSTSQYPDEDWRGSIVVADDNNASSTTDASSGTELASYMAYALVTNVSLDYGTVSPTGESDEDEITIKATGNVGLDEELSGVDMEKEGAPATTIGIAQQEYSTSTGFTWGGASSTAASVTPTEFELNCSKTTSTTTPATADTYWKIKIPDAQESGTYNGTNTVTGVMSETSTW